MDVDVKLILEIIGYIGSLLVVISMMMTSMVKLRIINSCGCVVTFFYSIMIASYPVLVLNALLFIINVYQLIRYYTRMRSYDVIDAEVAGFTLRHFLSKHRAKIKEQNPNFFHRYPDSNYAKVVFCDDTVVGMLVGRREADVLNVFMDYIDPNYWKKDLIVFIHNSIYKDGITKEIFKDIPEKYEKLYLKVGCERLGNDFIADLTTRF